MAEPPILVVGAGVGGLAAALALARAGRRVEVVERAPRIEEVGAGLQISPNAGRILQEFGLGPAMRETALEPQALRIRRAGDGAVLASLPLAAVRERWGAPFRVFHRADLQKLLLDEALRCGVEVATGRRCEGFVQDAEGLRLRLVAEAGAETRAGAAVIGADGLRSTLRDALALRPDDAPFSSGKTAWRAILPADALPAPLRERASQLWLGPSAHVVHYPLRDASIVSAVAILDDSADKGPPAETRTGAELAAAMGFTRWSADLRALIEAGVSWRRWPLFVRPELPRWGRGRVVLLGDAAHPMTPFLAQGAAQAIEDAAALGRALEGAAPIEAALEAYQAARMTRAAKVQRGSWRQGSHVHLRGPAAAARDLSIRLLGGRGMLARNAWLYR
ncbi:MULTISPECIES: FAD-dependent monooxygenase [Methylosinus]|uniref:Salicylate 1-monooxygenase n=1 Tax=Methylosinus trichosporium (strain ATCC 35070 / NCIMB 11131 / UNIQEM 75 / OB3b) TaxID=595536 RepID=A0A2D2CZE0_METT3|nr:MULTISPECIES: FAD-dependent monooxygenase [Methylosinus]ATQ68064.1 salicylate 1-monooxygenase [Methylosinus trichosporium OB3b]OBS51513.1 salicylate 1-monooxygenase [Methylosinus sp. 3S-1]